MALRRGDRTGRPKWHDECLTRNVQVRDSLPEQNQDINTLRARRFRLKKGHFWLIVAIVGTLLVVGGYFVLPRQSIEQQLAGMEAARAISASENAATIYSELLAGNGQIPTRPDFLDEHTDQIVSMRPWTGREYPELAEWIDHHQGTIARLIEAAEFDKCRFPILSQSDGHKAARDDRSWAMAAWADLLIRAANNDVGDGRPDEALCKYRCVVQLGKHISQQPMLSEYLRGLHMERFGILRLIGFVVQGDPNSTHLETIGHFPLEMKDDWVSFSQDITKVESLLLARNKPILTRLKYKIQGYSPEGTLQRFRWFHLEVLAHRRALKIVVALEQYRAIHGHWPQALDEVRAGAPAEAFIDPINDDSFVYRCRGNVFELYSKGKNGIDENGQYVAEIDPNSSDVIVQKDDIRFWPPSLY